MRTPAEFNGDWYPRDLPPGVEVSSHLLPTGDGAATRGWLYTPRAATAVVAVMHPRADASRHYLIPDLLDAGLAVWAQTGRGGGGDLRLVHESALLDIAAGLTFLRKRGFGGVGALGNSGGASLYTFYVQQSLRDPASRIARTPGGRPSGLPEADLPPLDAVAYLAPHPGQGALLLECIDPSVTDETDPLSADPALDLFDPANGFAAPPASSAYTPEFVQRYRAAQRARVARIDAAARALIDRRLAARTRYKRSGADADLRAATHMPVVTVHRTDADPRTVDLSLDPSDRRYGSVFGPRPHVVNYGLIGFGRMTTPEAWLSTWSGLSSNAAMAATAPEMTLPCLLVEYTGDNCVFPAQIRAVYDALGSTDKAHLRVRGDHFGRALDGDGPEVPARARTAVAAWLRDRLT
ncbi:alpha/beta hydrolase [Spongiactinospora gelatinilytica]|uniref:Alpha/beta hydrolase n=1 Tax=Spongiactinospora gelatinilytica TaxID=2666298 RepID=A0A2W2GLZ1_9ACTN|nr:alpha/beta hydrolase [Spongiactinospora gelatinilytica]PZG41055.1 alpha/beta hydrolase [Spongiactinospora gelatinilytica]